MTITTSRSSYDVSFGPLSELWKSIPESCFIITDTEVQRHWGWTVPHGIPVHAVESGEGSKSFETLERTQRWLAQQGANRQTTIIALGGGVVGDLAGFVASTYMRGVPYIQVPTSLLAMVDSSVGGKVAIDLPEGKNLVGAFYPPNRVHVPIETLSTLPDRHLRNGMAEVLKYGFIADPKIFDLIGTAEAGAATAQLEQLVAECIRIKAEIVMADEFERLGIRAKLNFGHTVGHAIETFLNYEGLLHGEAISIGMVVESRIGEMLGYSVPGTAQEVAERLKSAELPIEHECLINADRLIELMRSDKKSVGGQLAFSLVSKVGECKLLPDVPESVVRAALLDQ